MISLYKDPKGEKVFTKVYGGDGNNSIGGGHVSSSGDDVIVMRSRVIELEAELKIAKVSGGVVCEFMFVCTCTCVCSIYHFHPFPIVHMCVCVSPSNFLIFSCFPAVYFEVIQQIY